MLEARKVAVTRGGRTVFDDLSFTLSPGEVLLLEGPNGAGKSTLLRLCAGLLTPASGQISWCGQAQLALHSHYLGHMLGLKRGLTARENLSCAAARAGGSLPEMTALGMNLEEFIDLPVRLLSSGQRQRVALAFLAIVPRPIWLLDEPESGLDAASRGALQAALASHQQRAGVALIATHHAELFQPTAMLSFGD